MLIYKQGSRKTLFSNWRSYTWVHQLAILAAGTIACGRGVARGVGVKAIGLITLGLVVAAFIVLKSND